MLNINYLINNMFILGCYIWYLREVQPLELMRIFKKKNIVFVGIFLTPLVLKVTRSLVQRGRMSLFSLQTLAVHVIFFISWFSKKN